jgi:glycerol-3-phosphate dehydrogenase
VVSYKDKCVTEKTALVGARWCKSEIKLPSFLPSDVAAHLMRSYGDQAQKVADLAMQGFSKRLHEKHPFIEAEIIYTCRNEWACTVEDVLYRRLRLGFMDQQIISEITPRIDEIMRLC